MAPPGDDTWSDEDDELEVADAETAVQLGIPDGLLSSPADLSDPTVSRIGGHPVRCAFASPCTYRILIHILCHLGIEELAPKEEEKCWKAKGR